MNILSLEKKVDGLSRLWKEAEYNCAFWDRHSLTAWEDACRTALPAFLSENIAKLPVKMAYIGGQHVLVDVPEQRAGGIEPFRVVLAINGVPADEYFQNHIVPYCWQTKGESCYPEMYALFRMGQEGSEVVMDLRRRCATEIARTGLGSVQ